MEQQLAQKKDYTSVLDTLLENKKKNPNKEECDKYTRALASLIIAEGFSSNVEKYVYEGMGYCGAKPLYAYIMKQENPLDALNGVFKGKLFRKNLSQTASLLFHLLTVALNQPKPFKRFVIQLIIRIPKALKNKNGEFYGQAWRSFKKYMLNELHASNLPGMKSLVGFGLPISDAIQFKEFIIGILNAPDFKKVKLEKSHEKNICILSQWLGIEPYKVIQAPASDDGVDKEEPKKKENSKDEKEPLDKEINRLRIEIETLKAENSSLKSRMSSSSVELEEKLKKANSEIGSLNNQIKAEQAEKISLSRSLAEEKSKSDNLLSNLRNEQLLLGRSKEELDKLEKALKEKEQKIQDKDVFISRLKNGQENKTKFAMNRLGASLRGEYKDYLSAEGVPMSPQLGENLRKQLKRIFEIMLKAGIKI